MRSFPVFSSASAAFLGAGILSVLMPLNAQAAAVGLGQSYSQNFDSLASSGSSNSLTIPGWSSSRDSYISNNGTQALGGLYSYGSGSDRALGSLATNATGSIYYGALFQNDTNDTITSLLIRYIGEQWRNGGNVNPQSLRFSYQIGATNLFQGDWIRVTELDFLSPVSTSASSSLNGNNDANRRILEHVLNILLNPSETIAFRWEDINDQGNDHGLAIDDFYIAATFAPRSSNPTSIPTPALLPGLIGMGVAALRKKSQAEPVEQEA